MSWRSSDGERLGHGTLATGRTRRLFLAVDIGTSAVKAGLFDAAGNGLSIETVEYALLTTPPDRVECELSTYWAAVVEGVGAAVAAARRLGSFDICALAISSQGETLVTLDGDGQPLRPAIVWLDNRATAEAAELATIFGLDEIYRRTGQIESLATWTAAKIMWLAKHEPSVHARAGRFLLLEDWLVQRLTGEAVGDHSMYVTTLLLDISTRRWWPEMLNRLGVEPDRLSNLVSPGTFAGVLNQSAARDLGLPAGIPVIAGGLDQVLAATGAGNLRPGKLTENTGTTLGMATCLTDMPSSRERGLPMCLHVLPDLYCADPCGQTAGLVLRWFADNFYGTPATGTVSHQPYPVVINEASGVAPGADGLIVVPHLAGAQYPEYAASARGAIVGLGFRHSRGHIGRAVLEAVAYMLRSAIEAMRASGVHIDVVTSIGNSARSDVWTQIKADVCQVSVRRLACFEPTLLGAAMLAAVSDGEFSNVAEASHAMVHERDVVEPDAGTRDAYEAAFAKYGAVSAALRTAPGVLS